VLVDNVPLPAASDLPPDIRGLASRQYLRLNSRSAERDLRHLVDELARMLGEPSPPGDPAAAGNAAPSVGDPPSAEKYTVDIRNSRGVMVGDHGVQTNTFTQPPESPAPAVP
jgi:hypothetical protein